MEDVARLPGPHEILELSDGQSLTTGILRWERGAVEIHPYPKGRGKMIRALRIHVPQEHKGDRSHYLRKISRTWDYVPGRHKGYQPCYWDITSRVLIAPLMPHLERPGFYTRTFIITKHGVDPATGFTVEVGS